MHARKIFTISPKQKIQAALSAVKDGEDIWKAKRCILFLLHSSGLFDQRA